MILFVTKIFVFTNVYLAFEKVLKSIPSQHIFLFKFNKENTRTCVKSIQN